MLRLVSLSVFFILSAFNLGAEELTAQKLVRDIETQYMGKSSEVRTEMTIKTSNWERKLEMKIWSEGRDKFLTRIISPAKERGICTLKVENNIWNYLPRIDRMIKVPSSLMGESWMGSHLTNDDLVKENKIDKLYKLEIVASSSKEIVICGTPYKNAAVVWGKVLYVVDPKKRVPLYIDYYDEENVKVRRIKFSEVTRIGDRWIPRTMKVKPLEKPEEYTQMRYLELSFDVELPQRLFTLKSLRNRR